jgi:polyisoprenoid-binding protein YceI
MPDQTIPTQAPPEAPPQAEAPLTRTVDGAELPAPGTYAVDPAHTAVEFVVRHLGFAKLRGRFRDFHGTVEIADRSEDSTVAVDVDLASIDTGEPNRDERLRSSDFFDVPSHPTMSFRSTRVTGTGTDRTVEGDLTLRGVTHPATLAVTFDGAGADPFGRQRIAFSATGEIDRDRWGVSWNQPLDAGGFVIGKRVELQLLVQAVRDA